MKKNQIEKANLNFDNYFCNLTQHFTKLKMVQVFFLKQPLTKQIEEMSSDLSIIFSTNTNI